MDYNNLVREFLDENVATEEMLHSRLLDPFVFESIQGKVLDLGYGMGGDIAYFLNKNCQVIGIDKDLNCSIRLTKRLKRDMPIAINNLSLITDEITPELIPDEKFAVILLSNILHFFELHVSQNIISKCINNLMPGGLILIVVHSIYHPDFKKPDPFSYFKHYFTEREIEDNFDQNEFRRLYKSQTEYEPIREMKLLQQFNKKHNTPFSFGSTSDLEYIFQKKII